VISEKHKQKNLDLKKTGEQLIVLEFRIEKQISNSCRTGHIVNLFNVLFFLNICFTYRCMNIRFTGYVQSLEQ